MAPIRHTWQNHNFPKHWNNKHRFSKIDAHWEIILQQFCSSINHIKLTSFHYEVTFAFKICTKNWNNQKDISLHRCQGSSVSLGHRLRKHQGLSEKKVLYCFFYHVKLLEFWTTSNVSLQFFYTFHTFSDDW